MIDYPLFHSGFVSAFFPQSSCHVCPVPSSAEHLVVVQRRAHCLATPFYVVPATIRQVQARLGLVLVAPINETAKMHGFLSNLS